MTVLPIDAEIPRIVEALAAGKNLVIEAAPGAGKTTRVPPALLALDPREILVLEPRRLAARLAARRVAEELGESLGETVGYQVRFEESSGPKTRLRFLTEGILTRRLLTDPKLDRVSVVILDEFHERHLDTDLALALLRRLQRTARPDLRIVVMSATLDPDPVARFLGDAPVVSSAGRLFPIEIRFTPHSPSPLEQQVAGAVEQLIARGLNGDILVFLPGAAEIRRAARACEQIANRPGMLITPLHGDLSPAEQDRAVLPAARPKLILSTNVAESSITIDGVTAVIDSGLARIAADSPWTGLPSLEVGRISKASAHQRAGRAGRTAPGRVIRLFSEDDFVRRREQDPPEITRRELSQLVLDLHTLNARDIEWLEAPPAESLAAAEDLLARLDADRLRARMSKIPLPPRLARLVIEAEARDAGALGCAIAAALSAGERLTGPPPHPAPSDLLLLAEREWSYQTKRIYDQVLRRVRDDAHETGDMVRRPKASLLRRVDSVPCHLVSRGSGDETGALMAVLAAFPDRVARRRQGSEYNLAAGGSAVLAETSGVHNAPFIVAVDVETRRERGLPLIRLASAIEPEWLIDLFPERIEERDGVEWNRTAERVEHVSAMLYDGLVISETRSGSPDPRQAAELLAAKVREAGIEKVVDVEALDQFRARVEFASQHSSIPAITEAHLHAALTEACAGKRTFAELSRLDLISILRAQIPGTHRLDEIAPARIRLAGGRETRVKYAVGQTPWVASRLQDFFGMRQTPQAAGVPMVVHLLAPNQRPVQMTSDLAGFWERLYPQVRRELSRRYPRHKWPEDPTAVER